MGPVSHMITETDWYTIKYIWKDYLWPIRASAIEPHSAMLLDGTFEIKNFDNKATFLVYHENGSIAGCNSGHLCNDNSYRSRGLYVFPQYRKKGIGKKLLEYTINIARKENADLVWSYPRYESWNTYKSAGFSLVSDWAMSETGVNAYCVIKF